MEAAADVQMASPRGEPPERPRHLQPASPAQTPSAPPVPGGGGGGGADASKIVESLRASAEQEFQIAERLSTKARQAFALAAAVFTVAQTVAFGNFEAQRLSGHEKWWMIVLAVVAVVMLAVAALGTLRADNLVASGDLPLDDLQEDLIAAHTGDQEVVGRLGRYYLGIVRSRREANKTRRKAYKLARTFVACSLLATTAELIVALIARTS